VEEFLCQGDSNQKRSRAPLPPGLAPSTRFLNESSVDHLKLRSRTVVRNRSSDLGSSSVCSDSYVIPPKRQERNPCYGHRQKRGFKERIYQAAIASGVEPINVLVQPKDTPLSKPPLSFQLLSPPRSRRNRGSILTPNRKNNPFQDPRFTHAPYPSKPKVPLSRRHTALRHHSEICNQETGTKETCATQLTFKPLHFVPLLQAEEGYKALFVRAQPVSDSTPN